MSTLQLDYSPAGARERLRQLIKERAYRDGLDIVLTSGKRSTFYIDGKKISLHPEGLCLLALLLLDELEAFPDVTAIGGLTLGADPIAAAVAALSFVRGRPLSAFLVRKEPKRHGTGERIEGELAPGQRVAIVEDTITTGKSARIAIEAVHEAGAEVACVLALADREDSDADAFRAEYAPRSLFTVSELRS